MFRMYYEKKPYADEVKLFQVSPDLVMAALVINNNQILIMNVSGANLMLW